MTTENTTRSSVDEKSFELAEHFLSDLEGDQPTEEQKWELAKVIQDAVEGWLEGRTPAPRLIRCTACIGGRWEAECCNGSSGCSCGGEPVDMGRCLVCNGTGWRTEDADVRANANLIRGRCYLGSGPRG